MKCQIVKEAFLITLIAVGAAFLINHFSPVGIALIGSWDQSRGVISARAKHDAVDHRREVQEVEAVKALYDRGDTVFVDARVADDYQAGHIRGAISVPLGEFEKQIEFLFANYPPETPMITYCTGRECRDSHELAQMLIDAGYEHVTVFSDGYPAWKEEGFPVESADE